MSDFDQTAIAPGKQGQTLCPLRPFGRIEIAGQTYDAKAESGWIDATVDVVVVGTGSFGIVVRESRDPTGEHVNSPENVSSAPCVQTATKDRDCHSENPYHGPEFWLEQANVILVGAILWTAVGSLLLLSRPLSLEFLLLPVGGAIGGAVFQYFIRGSRDLEGPYSDHRPKAYVFALTMLGGAAFAVAAVYASGGGVAIITVGLVLGTLGGGILLVAVHML